MGEQEPGGDAERTVRTRVWQHGKLTAEDFPLDRVSDQLTHDGCVVWADVVGDDHETLGRIADELGLDPHAVEDAVSAHERPKIDRYDGYLFLNTHAVRFDRAKGTVDVRKISAFITEHALITVHHQPILDSLDLLDRWDSAPELLEYGVAGLLHGLVDVVVDSHFDAVQALDEEIDGLEDLLFDDKAHGREIQLRTFALRKSLVRLRRVVLPMREVVNTMMRRDHHLLDVDLLPYYQDVYDHVLRASEWTESLRDMVSTVFETNLSLQDARLNNIMKKLTSWAAIIAVPTAVTGFYGQNVPYPGDGSHWGFWVSSIVIVVLAIALYSGFKKRDWL
ncbi:MAG TPA: magnesium transporter CorA family protein [Mycobacteriales bacterium]|jgi:magnesium transporter|nr:magnesium transporter CorA family protein [Mycobacteriales bacterium]